MCKNLEKPSKHVAKIVHLVSLHFFLRIFLIAGVIGSFLVVFNWQRRWHPLNANCTKGLLLENQTPLRYDPILFQRMRL